MLDAVGEEHRQRPAPGFDLERRPVGAPQAQRTAVSLAKKAGAVVSTDVNFRPALWRDAAEMIAAGREAVAVSNIVKVSEAELRALTGQTAIAEAAKGLWHPDLALLAVTCGEKGAELFTAERHVAIPAYAAKVVDTVGCGDAFMAALLSGMVAVDSLEFDAGTIYDIGDRACAAGAVMAGTAGAMKNMPLPRQIAALLETSMKRGATPG